MNCNKCGAFIGEKKCKTCALRRKEAKARKAAAKAAEIEAARRRQIHQLQRLQIYARMMSELRNPPRKVWWRKGEK